MELTGQQRIAAPIDRTWVALNDPGVLKECITGCESIERVSDREYAMAMAVKIGPVNAKFRGKLFLENLQPPNAYTINFEGQGGVAGFGKGSADVKLTPDNGATILDYTAKAQVGGKIAQIGSRLVDIAAKKMADDFFTAFNTKVAGAAATAAADAAAEAVSAGAGAVTAAGEKPAASASAVPPGATSAGTPVAKSGAVPMWVWAAVAAAIVALIVLFTR